MIVYLLAQFMQWGVPPWVQAMGYVVGLVTAWITARYTGRQKKVELGASAEEKIKEYVFERFTAISEARLKEQDDKIGILEDRVTKLTEALSDRELRLRQAAAACEACHAKLKACKQSNEELNTLTQRQTRLIETLQKQSGGGTAA